MCDNICFSLNFGKRNLLRLYRHLLNYIEKKNFEKKSEFWKKIWILKKKSDEQINKSDFRKKIWFFF